MAYEPRKLPVILGLEEVTRLLQSAGGPKYQAALGVAYGAGLRASEVVHLTTGDIDRERIRKALLPMTPTWTVIYVPRENA